MERRFFAIGKWIFQCIALITVLEICLTVSSASAIDGVWKRYLDCSIITGIEVDGNDLWAATMGGIVRWNIADGTYRIYDSTDGLSSESWNYPKAGSILTDSKGVKWSSIRFGGMAYFNGSSWNMLANIAEINNMDIAHMNCPRSASDHQGNIWYAISGGLLKWDGARWAQFLYPTEQYGEQYVGKTICIDSQDVVWVAGSYLVSCFDGKTWSSLPILSGGNGINSIGVDSKGIVWAGSDALSDGLTIHRFNGNKWESFTREQTGLPYTSADVVAVDRNDTVWFGTPGGVTSYDGNEWRTYTTDNGLADNEITAIYVDKANVKWFGTGNYAISRYDGSTWKTYDIKEKLHGNRVSSVLVDRNNVRWFGTNSGVTRFDGNTWRQEFWNGVLAVGQVSLQLESTGIIWAISTTGLGKFDGQTWTRIGADHLIGHGGDYTYSAVRDLFIASDNRKWVISENNLSVYDDHTWAIYTDKDGLPSNRVRMVRENGNKIIWIGTDAGVASFDGKAWKKYADIAGAPEGDIGFLTIDNNNTVWCIDSQGIHSYNGNAWTVYTYDEENYSRPVSVQTITVDKNNVKWFGGYGLFSFDGISWVRHERFNQYGIRSVIVDHSNHVWVTKYRDNYYGEGVSVYDGISWTDFILPDGLADNAVTGIYVDSENVKWFTSDYWGACSFTEPGAIVGVSSNPNPDSFSSIVAYPNPFNPETSIQCTTSRDAMVQVSIYNIAGQRIKNLFHSYRPAGTFTLRWNGKDNDGSDVSTGVYFVCITTGKSNVFRKILLQR